MLFGVLSFCHIGRCNRKPKEVRKIFNGNLIEDFGKRLLVVFVEHRNDVFKGALPIGHHLKDDHEPNLCKSFFDVGHNRLIEDRSTLIGLHHVA